MAVDFDLTLQTDAQFNAKVDDSENDFSATFDVEELFDVDLSPGTETFTATMENDNAEFSADFGTGQQIDTARVRSVNGMVGDVVIHVPELVSELENDVPYIDEHDVHALTNMEIENLIS